LLFGLKLEYPPAASEPLLSCRLTPACARQDNESMHLRSMVVRQRDR